MSTSSNLSKLIISPRRLANVINWKRSSGSTTMCLDIASDRIGLATASHTRTENTVCHLSTLSYKTSPKTIKEVNAKIAENIQEFNKNNRIDGFLINWPLESDNRFGKQCGKVLHLLDFLAGEKLISKRIPFTLWDGRDALATSHGTQITKQNPPDEWGRSVSFALKPPKTLTEYKHSENISNTISSEDSSDAGVILEDYICCHFDNKKIEKDQHGKVSRVAAAFRDAINYQFDSYESHGAYIQAQLL